jgi:hypothetical protein
VARRPGLLRLGAGGLRDCARQVRGGAQALCPTGGNGRAADPASPATLTPRRAANARLRALPPTPAPRTSSSASSCWPRAATTPTSWCRWGRARRVQARCPAGPRRLPWLPRCGPSGRPRHTRPPAA